jgi:hypothetical protein
MSLSNMLRYRELISPARRFLSSQQDLSDSLQSLSSSSFDGYLPAEKTLSKFNSELFFGKQLGDDITNIPGIEEARNKTMKMLSDGSRPIEFANLAHDVLVKHLEDKEHRFAVPSGLMFNGRDSPVRPLFDEALMKAFTTARCALRGECENFSGFAIAGTKGTGKSTLTRLVALLTGLLIPNFQTVFVDLVRCEDLEIDHLLREAATIAGIPGVTGKDSLRTVIGRFTRNKCGIGLFLDELPTLYSEKKKREWAKIHSVLDSFGPTFVIANGSASALPAMVRRDIRDFALLKKLMEPTAQPLVSLNGTKMKVKMLSRFTKPEQYKKNFYARPPLCSEFVSVCAKEEEFIRYLHLVSGGVLRRIRQVNEHSKSLDLADWVTNYPDDDTLEKAIFVELIKPIDSGSKKFDVFDMPVVSEDKLEQILHDHYLARNNEERKSIHDLVDNDVLQVIEKGTSRHFTFGNPAYFKLTMRSPVVFISHRMGDIDALSTLIEGLWRESGGRGKRKVRVVSCEDGASQECIRKRGLKYMDLQCVTGITDKCGEEIRKVAVVLLTDNFIRRIEEYFTTNVPNGCARELLKLVESDQSHVYYFKAADLDRKEAVRRLETANPEWKGKLGDKVYYSLEEPEHFKLLANTVLSNAYEGDIELAAGRSTATEGSSEQ